MCQSKINLTTLLDAGELSRLKKSVQEAQRIETRWTIEAKRVLDNAALYCFDQVQKTGKVPTDFDFLDLFVEHAFEITAASFRRAYSDVERHGTPKKKLAKAPPAAHVPRNLSDLMKLWDRYRKREYIPKRQKKFADNVKKAFLERVQDVWEKNSKDFRESKVYDQSAVREQMMKAARTTHSRAKMIVETETTFYYNRVRRHVYDQSQDVTHYLFLAIRDSATTPWCKTRTGIVYAKGDPLLDDETPPCHWNCRSEIVPLLAINPRHLALIQNKSLARRNRKPHPLPKGWHRRAA